MHRLVLASAVAALTAACSGSASQAEVAVDEAIVAPTAAPKPRTRRPLPDAPVDTSDVKGRGPFTPSDDPALLDPLLATATAPAEFRVLFRTTAGNFAVDCHREWAPLGADRIYNLVKIGFFDDVAFYRVVSSPQPFVAQFGIHADPAVSAAWKDARLPIDPVVQSNTTGTLTFAMAGKPDTRTTQVFLNLTDNARLDAMGFAPVCAVVDDGMVVVRKLYGGYGEKPTREQGEMTAQGNAYVRDKWPDLDFIATARVVPIPPPAANLPPATSAPVLTPPASATGAPASTSTSPPPRSPVGS